MTSVRCPFGTLLELFQAFAPACLEPARNPPGLDLIEQPTDVRTLLYSNFENIGATEGKFWPGQTSGKFQQISPLLGRIKLRRSV